MKTSLKENIRENGLKFVRELRYSGKKQESKQLLRTFHLLAQDEIIACSERIEWYRHMIEKYWREVTATDTESEFIDGLYPNDPLYIDWVYDYKGTRVKRLDIVYSHEKGRDWVLGIRAVCMGRTLLLRMLFAIEDFVSHLKERTNFPQNYSEYHQLKLLSRFLRATFKSHKKNARKRTSIICDNTHIKCPEFVEKIKKMTGFDTINIDNKSPQCEDLEDISDRIDELIRKKFRPKNYLCINGENGFINWNQQDSDTYLDCSHIPPLISPPLSTTSTASITLPPMLFAQPQHPEFQHFLNSLILLPNPQENNTNTEENCMTQIPLNFNNIFNTAGIFQLPPSLQHKDRNLQYSLRKEEDEIIRADASIANVIPMDLENLQIPINNTFSQDTHNI